MKVDGQKPRGGENREKSRRLHACGELTKASLSLAHTNPRTERDALPIYEDGGWATPPSRHGPTIARQGGAAGGCQSSLLKTRMCGSGWRFFSQLQPVHLLQPHVNQINTTLLSASLLHFSIANHTSFALSGN
ncbi:hypothetical protein AOLI_G00053510 [Acnodon oligacanthus]